MKTNTQLIQEKTRTLTAALWVLAALGLCSAKTTTRADNGLDHQVLQSLPISLGTSGGNANSVNLTVTPTRCCSGTLGGLVQDQAGNQYILSSNWTMARSNEGQIGDDITQPGLRDACGQPLGPYNVVADLSAFVPINFKNNKAPYNYVDAAIALVRPGAVDSTGSILDIGRVSHLTLAPSLGLAVKKSGRGTGLTVGTIAAINVSVDIGFATGCNTATRLNARLVNQFKIGTAGFTVMTSDSGALVVADEANPPRPVGIACAVGSGGTIASPIDTVLAQLSLRLGSTLSFPNVSSLVGAATTAGTVESLSTAPSASAVVENLISGINLERARMAQERHFEALFNVQDVVGHGIGLSEEGEPTIEVYLRRENARSRARIPAALNEVPVRVIVTGPFTAN